MAACAAVAAPPSPARAEEEPPPVVLDEVVVGVPRTEAAADPTASATVVSADRFEGEAKGVAQLVATAPGVAVQEYGGLGQLATVSIRGSTADGVLVLLDGIPLDTAFGGGVDLASIPRAWIERIEVVRGVEGAAYGAGALGGVVNVVTRRAAAGTWAAEMGGGSFETLAVSAEGAGALGNLALGAAAGVDSTSGRYPFLLDLEPSDPTNAPSPAFRENNAAVRGGALATLGGRLGRARLDALLQLSAGEREIPAQAPRLDATSTDRQKDGRVLAAARLSRPGVAPGLDLSGLVRLRADWLDVRVSPAPLARQRGGEAGLEARATLAHRAGALEAALVASGEALRADGLGGTRVRGSLGLSASETLGLLAGRLRLAPAVRLDRVGPFTGLSWKAGAWYRLAGAISARASAGRTFRAPSFAELWLRQGLVDPNPDLVPEEGLGADASLVYDGPLGLAALGAHATRYRDLVIYEPAGPDGRLRPRNVGEAFLAGLEAELATAPARRLLGLAGSASYTFLATENLRAPPQEIGKDLPRRPRHRLYARAEISPGPAEAHVEVHWVGRQFEDARNVNAIEAALAWNAGAALRAGRTRAVRLSVEVRNLLDDRTLKDPYGSPLPGRMVMVTLRAASGRKGSEAP
ncbi:MAG TPA: TonB-dependent receptor [Anaeromyxobacteraceae bacterium]|nr:TonB-dependent receptor [Anaeromyxobacteraceae bacterium]